MQKKWSKTLTFSFHTTIIIVNIIAIIVYPSFSYANDDSRYSACSLKLFNCENFKNLTFPFWGNTRPSFCGHPSFKLDCDEKLNTTIIKIKSTKYRVIDLNVSSRILTIARLDLAAEAVCPVEYPNTVLDTNWFNYTSADNITTLFYDCPQQPYSHPLNEFSCDYNNTCRIGYLNITVDDQLKSQLKLSCKNRVIVPILEERIYDLFYYRESVRGVLNAGFEVKFGIDPLDHENCVRCNLTGGACGYNSTKVFICFCRQNEDLSMNCLNQAPPQPPPQPLPLPLPLPPPLPPPKSGTKSIKGLKFVIGFGAAGLSIILMLAIFFIRRRRNKQNYVAASYVSRNTSLDYSSMEDLEKRGNACGVYIFSYSELLDATNNFDTSKELGDGGFGTVYYGKLKDGRVVAVKRLYENNFRRVEQFMNEVRILTHMRHQNLVLLYGCTSRHSQELLLVYEYIPNGTVADHLHGEGDKHGSLNWSTRLKIAIETASALVYLHASEVIHRDVKTTNILLDNSFCVKVADFGLSRLFPTGVTHVSTIPQGTPGYVDPDYHQCYQLTDKSDVYSFGVVMIELISSRPAVDITRHRHEINLSNMAITKIQNGELHELVDMSLGYESDSNIKNMICAVAELAFQCLQSDKDLRPTMEEVFNTLIEIQENDPNVVKERQSCTFS